MIVSGCCRGLADSGIMPPMKYWEIIADKLSAVGWLPISAAQRGG